MKKKEFILYSLVFIFFVIFVWQWLSRNSAEADLQRVSSNFQKADNFNLQLQKLSGIGPLNSAHLHADVKVYINGDTVDFSQKKYQIEDTHNNFVHFEEGIGDVIHIHATGLTIRHMIRSVNLYVNNNCLTFEGTKYCNDGNKKLKFYVNGKASNEFGDYVINDLDKILVSYGPETDLSKQLASITNLAPELSGKNDDD